MSDAAVIVVIGVGTYVIRTSFIAVLGTRGVPPILESPLRYVAPAVLAAIAAPPILAYSGPVDLTPANLRLVAALAAGVVAWRTRNIGLTIVVGLAGLAILEGVV